MLRRAVQWLILEECPQLEHNGKRFLAVCPMELLPLHSVRVVCLPAAQQIAVFHLPEGLFAVDNHCAHQHVPVLAEGTVEGTALRCPRHGWCYDLRDGRALEGCGRLRVYEVLQHEGMLYLEAPEPEGAPWG